MCNVAEFRLSVVSAAAISCSLVSSRASHFIGNPRAQQVNNANAYALARHFWLESG